MNTITVTCGEIQTSLGFLNMVSSAVLNQTLNPDCEQSWFLEDGLKIADPSAPETLIDPVVSVSSDRLVTSRCLNLNHEIICDSAESIHYSHLTMLRVRNETAATPDVLNEVTPSLQLSDQFWWLFAIFVILMCFMQRKRIFRCFPKAAPSVCQRNDSENRDPESGVQIKVRSESLNHSESDETLKKVRSDAPDSLNQSESDSLNHSESDGTLKKVRSDAPDSLNQSESDSLNHSESDGTLKKVRSDAPDSLNQSESDSLNLISSAAPCP